MKVGFVVNPIAGMGGSVGLKGTDGQEILREAIERGAARNAPARAVAALTEIKNRRLDVEFLTAEGEMGAAELAEAGLSARVVAAVPVKSTAEDTARVVRTFAVEGAELILFAGGDGTARDVVRAIDSTVPILGIPAGVKMQSSVFAVTPEMTADAVSAFIETGKTREAEVMDVDEEGFREGVLRAKLYGTAKVPDDSASLQATKNAYHSMNADEEADELGKYLAENMAKGVFYIVGPGSTTAAVARNLGAEKTILGVDVFLDGRTVVRDGSESDLARILTEGRPARIVVSPLGAQGFFLGRGNQQISAKIVKMVGRENVIVIATPAKLLGTPVLRVDTGDSSLDAAFRGRMRVVTGYGRRRLVRVA